MNIILGPRGCGKTTQLIILASCNNQTIVCETRVRCEAISKLALQMGVVIREPKIFRDFVYSKEASETVVIDNVEGCLNSLDVNKRVSAVTLEHGSENNFINLRYGGHRL